MAKLTRARAEERAAALQAEYAAWQARAEVEGQDALSLRRLIGRARALLRQARRLEGTSGRAVAARVSQQIATFRAAWDALIDVPNGVERAEIDDLTDALLGGEAAAAQRLAARLAGDAPGGHAAAVEVLGLRASFLLGRYARHFAGKPRATRDPYLLADMQRYLSRLVERLAERVPLALDPLLMERIEVLTDQLALWAEESDAIGPARRALPPAGQARALAALSDGLASEWDVQVESYPATTVRARLVKRLVAGMAMVRIELAALTATSLLDDPDAIDALARVEARLAAWRNARVLQRRARRGVTLEARARTLQAEVAESILQWAREISAGADGPAQVVRMGELCDRLQELERQLDKAVRDGAGDASVRLLGYVRARLVDWETAWERATSP